MILQHIAARALDNARQAINYAVTAPTPDLRRRGFEVAEQSLAYIEQHASPRQLRELAPQIDALELELEAELD